MRFLGKALKATVKTTAKVVTTAPKVATKASKIVTSKPAKTAFTIGSFLLTKNPKTYVQNKIIDEVGGYTYKKSKGIFKNKILNKIPIVRNIAKSEKVGTGVKGVEKLVWLTWRMWFKK